MSMNRVDQANGDRAGERVPLPTDLDWPQILAQSLSQVAEKREKELQDQQRREKEERARYSYD